MEVDWGESTGMKTARDVANQRFMLKNKGSLKWQHWPQPTLYGLGLGAISASEER
jgi:hypothetical protein